MENPSSAENQANYEYEYSPEDVVIDPFTCDLNLVVDKECLLAYPLSSAGFCSMWAGCRATYGVSSGRVAFEIHMTDYCECPDLAKDDLEPNLIRVGWSINYSSLQLGESELSFGYASNGKKCCNKTFEDYGDQFDKADSIAAYIDFESEKDTIVISYSKNGIDQGIAFRLKRAELENHVTKVTNDCSDSVLDKDKFKSDLLVFFPHVLTKNVVFEVNFGQRVSLIGDEPFAPIKSGFELIQKRPLDARFSNAPPRVKRDKNEYEVILMIGLPGSGKTNWANEYIRKHVKENYYIIGIGSILEKMKMLGIRKKANISQAGELAVINSLNANSLAKISSDLLDKTLKCMNVLMDIASHSLRNTIIDQPNVFTSTRRRNLNIFKGFRTKAVVIVPNDEVYKQRVDQLAEDIKSTLPFIINNMKIGFTLPKPGEFDSIEYAELDEEESRKLIAIYNSQGAEDRLDRLLLRRAKKNEDIRKNSKLNPALFMRPTYRPQFPYGSSTSSFTSRPRFGAQILPPGAAGAAAMATMGFPRRPFNQPYPNQYLSNAAYGNQQLVYAYSPSLVTSPTGATVVGLAPNQATADPNLIFNQWPQQQQMQFNMYGMSPSPYQAHHAVYHQQQQAAQQQYAPIYGPNPTQPKQAAYQTQNSWDPVVSTNLSHSIASSSAYSTDLASNLTTKTPENSNNDTNQN